MSSPSRFASLCMLLCLAVPAAAQEHDHGAPERLGAVSFATSCRAEVRETFGRGVAMLHSFWFSEAERVFAEVAAADPSCAMAHWGTAVAKRGNPFAGAPAAANLAAGLQAAERAASLMAGATPREQGFIRAVLAFYRDQETRDHRTRMAAYEAAMREVAEQNPDDTEATIFHAQSIIANAPPSDLTFARQRAAAAILEPLFERQPQHPGLAHYLIHAYDAPPLARQGLSAAERYSAIAPSAPHALHMPSHVFTRLGMWDESIESNLRAAAAEGPTSPHRVHPVDYLVYAYLQQGRDRDAVAAASMGTAQTGSDGAAPVVRYNQRAMTVRPALERARWAEAAELPVAAGDAPEIEAVMHFARGIGAARSGRPGRARAEVAELDRLEQALRARGDTYWPVIVGAQRQAVEAWIARAENRTEDALRLAEAAAAQEESVEKHPVTPGPLLPARELQADLLLELGRPADAQRAYEANLAREPNRARTLYGAAVAAERAGAADAARAHYQALARLMAHADPERPEIAAARAALGSR